MSNLELWPALSGFTWETGPPLQYERGVWGKAHGARSDYRWLARSAGFAIDQNQLGRDLNVGHEEDPIDSFYWRSFDSGAHYAVSGYLSKAVDKSGRHGFFEKQVIEWKRPPTTPAVIGAVLLGIESRRYRNELWWHHRDDTRWSDSAFSIEITPDALPPIVCSAEAFAQAIGQGLEELCNSTSEVALARAYAQLDAGNPAVLAEFPRPASAELVAAFLLPLQCHRADRVSVAGWLPSRRCNLVELQARWNVVFLAATYAQAEAPDPGDSAIRRGERMAQAVFNRSPRLLEELREGPVASAQSLPPQAAGPASARGALSNDENPDVKQTVLPLSGGTGRDNGKPRQTTTSAAAGRPNTASSDSKMQGRRNPPTPDPVRWVPVGGRFIQLTKTSLDSQAMQDVYRFARDSEKRFLTPQRVRESMGRPNSRTCVWKLIEPNQSYVLAQWTKEIADQWPHYADTAQRDVKLAVMRAAHLALDPHPQRARQFLGQCIQRVPLLLFFPLVWEPGDRPLHDFAPPDVARLFQQCLECLPPVRDELLTWVRNWARAHGYEFREARQVVARWISAGHQ